MLFANTDWYIYNFRRSQIEACLKRGDEVLVICPRGNYVQRLENLGCRCIVAPMNRKGVNPFSEFFFIIWLFRALRDKRPDLVHAFTIKCSAYAGFVTRVLGLSCVCAIAGVGYVFAGRTRMSGLLRPPISAVLRFAFNSKRCLVIFQNPDNQKMFVDAGIVSAGKARLIRGSGVNTTVFTPARPGHKEGEGTDRIKVLLPARMLWDKGIREFVDAAKRLRVSGPKVEMILAGGVDIGNPSAIGEEQLLQWAEKDGIRWLRHVDDMAGLYREVDLVVLPSDYGEGLPKSLLEASASGLPLVTTDAPGCKEVVIQDVNGLLIPPRDSVALELAILKLANDRDLRVRMGKASRELVLANFDDNTVVSATFDVYEELVY